MASSKLLRVSLLQLFVNKESSKAASLDRAVYRLREAASSGSEILILPQFFCNPKIKNSESEVIPSGYTSQILSQEAKNLKKYIVGGTILEKEDNSTKIYNTVPVFGPSGKLLTHYRKVHKTDASAGSKEVRNDFDLGSKVATFSVGNWKIGIIVCFDLYFTELCKIYADLSCDAVIMITIWPKVQPYGDTFKPLMITRASEHQMYFIGTSQARDNDEYIVRQSHSIVTEPSGAVLYEAGTDEETVNVTLDLDKVSEIRDTLRLSSSRRTDLYRLTYDEKIVEPDGRD